MSAKDHHSKGVLVVGLGRFGGAMAQTLTELGHEVLGVDSDARRVHYFANICSHTVQLDTTDAEALRQIGAGEFRRAVVGIGSDIENSILTVAALIDLGIEEIWAKAVTRSHGQILERVGAHHVVFPEHEMGERVAHIISGRVIDYMEIDKGFALVETKAPVALVGKTLGETGIRKRYGVTVVCIKPAGEAFTYATSETVIGADDLLVVAGVPEAVTKFAAAA